MGVIFVDADNGDQGGSGNCPPDQNHCSQDNMLIPETLEACQKSGGKCDQERNEQREGNKGLYFSRRSGMSEKSDLINDETGKPEQKQGPECPPRPRFK